MGHQQLLLPFVGTSHRFIWRGWMGPNGPPSPPPSFPNAAISDSRSQRVPVLPMHRRCRAQPALSPAPWDALAGMGQLVPPAPAVLIPGSQDAGAPALPHHLHGERLFAGSAGTELLITPGGCLTMMDSGTCRFCRQTPEGGPGSGSWLGGSRRREAGGSRVPAPSSWSRDGRCSQRTANGRPAQPRQPGHPHSTHRELLSPPVITGTKQQFQENGKKRGSWGKPKGWRDPGKTESSWAVGQERNRVGLRERKRKPRSSSHSLLTAIQREESIRVAAGGALGDAAQAPCFSGRTVGIPPCSLGTSEETEVTTDNNTKPAEEEAARSHRARRHLQGF